MVFGAFDKLHPGHLDFFRQAIKEGNHLTVVVGRDETVFYRKQRLPQESEKARLGKVRQVPGVDYAVLGKPSKRVGEQLEIISKIRPDLICLGYDQEPDALLLRRLLQEQGLGDIKIKTLKPYHPEKFKSSKLKSSN